MLPSINRLTKKTDFENVRQYGKREVTPELSVSYFNRKDSNPVRVGFIVSKKISTKAHVRNRIKRVLREITAKNMKEVKNGGDYVIIAKSGIVHAIRATIEASLVKCLRNF